MEAKYSAVPWIAAFMLLLALLPCAYAAGYFLLGEYDNTVFPEADLRIYSSEWEMKLFTPGAQLESLFRGKEVQAVYTAAN